MTGGVCGSFRHRTLQTVHNCDGEGMAGVIVVSKDIGETHVIIFVDDGGSYVDEIDLDKAFIQFPCLKQLRILGSGRGSGNTCGKIHIEHV